MNGCMDRLAGMRALAPVVAVVVLLLAGCAPLQPSRTAVAERFAIELEAATDGLLERDAPEVLELADGAADAALEGMCADPAYWNGIGAQPSLEYAWAMTCDMHFSEEMPESLQDRARGLLLDRIAEDVSED